MLYIYLILLIINCCFTHQGALVGSISALTFNLWIGAGARMYGTPAPKLPSISLDGCFVNSSLALVNSNFTTLGDTLTTIPSINYTMTSIDTISYPR